MHPADAANTDKGTGKDIKDKPPLEVMKTSRVVPVDSDPSAKYSLSEKEESKEDGFDGHDDELEEDDGDKMESMWQGRCLSVMESMPALLFILGLVAVAGTSTSKSKFKFRRMFL